jgi:hypothetical protein
MCSIIGSKDINKVRELAELNAYRGQHSHSLFVYDDGLGTMSYQHKDFGPLVTENHKFDMPEVGYIVAHQQAPTTENKTSEFIHPATIGGTEMLWHNGIVKANDIKRLQQELQCENSWDTYLILRHLLDYNTPNGIDGTFSCVWLYDGNLFVFRNEISPLFIDNELNISSTKFSNSESLPPNTIFMLDIENSGIKKISEFQTKENPYFFGV